MTITPIAQIVLIGMLLIGVDFLILHFRREAGPENWTRALNKVFPPAIFSIFTRIRSILSTRPENSPEQAETVPDLPTSPDVEIVQVLPESTNAELEALPAATRVESASTDEKYVIIHIDAKVPPDIVLNITISTDKEGRIQSRQKTTVPRRLMRKLSLPNPLPFLRAALRAAANAPVEKLAPTLFVLALLAYLLTRLIGLTDFPIYFFGDEAIQTTSAFDLVQRGMRGPNGTFLPTYFQNGLYFNLGVSVYLQIIPLLLFGKSIFVTRATSALVTLLAAICVGLTLKHYFSVKRWWLATLLLSVTPAWFLHSRTAFETVLFVSFYAAFLYFYLGYRLRNPNLVYWAVIFAGLAFYSYSPGQLVLAVTGVFLFLSDLKYHWQQRITLLKAAGLLTIVALPYLRFRLTFTYSPLDHLRSLGSYWIQPLPVTEKITSFLHEYLRGLSPQYWFSDAPDMERHRMRGYGNIPFWFAPLLLGGIVQALLRWRSPAHRLLLLVLLAAPSGAALAEIGITRILVFVIPATLLAALGLEWLLEGLFGLFDQIKNQISRPFGSFFSSPAFNNALTLALFTLLIGINFYMLSDTLRNGPTWYQNYGLYGMQYGAKQIFQETAIPLLQQDPEAQFTISPSWANGAEHFAMFFTPNNLMSRLFIGQIYDYLDPPREFSEKDYYIVTALEFENIKNDPKFKQVIVRSIISYPNGKPGFYVLNIRVADNLQELLEAEKLIASTPIEETIEWMGQTVRVQYLPLGGGSLQNVVDGDIYSLARGDQANPFFYEFFFSQPVSATQLALTTGSMGDFTVIVKIYAVGESTPVEYDQRFIKLGNDPTVNIPFSAGPAQFDRLFISIKDNIQGEFANIHVREIELR